MDQGDLRDQRDAFLAFAFASADLLMEADGDLRVRFALGASERLLGVPLDRLEGCRLEALVAEEDWPVVRSVIDRLQTGQRFGPNMVRLHRLPGVSSEPDTKRRGLVSIGGCRMPFQPQRLYLAVSEARVGVIPPDSAAEWADAPRDATTGLLEVDGFRSASEGVVREARRLGQNVTMTLLELQGLKGLELRTSQDKMREFLREFGGYLKSRSLWEASGRIGDEKFGVVHDTQTRPDDIEDDVIEMSRRFDPTGAGIEVLASAVDIDPNLEEEDAGRALVYTINTFARDLDGDFTVKSLNDAARRMMEDALSRIAEFKSAVRDKQIKLVSQPIVNLTTRHTHHHEILARFVKEQNTFRMVSFAEDVGIIQELDLAIAESAIDLLTRYLPRRSGQGHSTRLAVNLSGRSLRSDIFVRMLMNLLKSNPGQEDRLLFEVTESAKIDDLEAANAVLQDLRQLGYRVCLDDFGSGAASFQYLQAFDIDFIKIDGAYVKGLRRGERESVMLASMASLARSLGVGTIAEMVETEAEVEELRRAGIEFGQGFLFGKPRPITELVAADAQRRKRA